MKKNYYYLLTISFIFINTILLGPLSLITNVSADEDDLEDLGVKEGDIFKWHITKVDNEEYDLYEVGDTMTIKIDSIEYYKDEESWMILFNLLNFMTEEGDDLFVDRYFTLEENASLASIYPDDDYFIIFIPSKDLEKYLEVYSELDSDFDVDGSELKYISGDEEYIWEFNDSGIPEKYTEKVGEEVILEFELLKGISFGITFLFFIPIGILGCIYLIKKKECGVNNE